MSLGVNLWFGHPGAPCPVPLVRREAPEGSPKQAHPEQLLSVRVHGTVTASPCRRVAFGPHVLAAAEEIHAEDGQDCAFPSPPASESETLPGQTPPMGGVRPGRAAAHERRSRERSADA